MPTALPMALAVAAMSGSDAINDARVSMQDSAATANAIGNAVGMGYQYLGGAQGVNSLGNQGYVQSGLKYDTAMGSQQTDMLSNQERGFGLL